MRRHALPALALLAALLPAAPALSQADQEARLREALRRATADLRSLQDAQARLQAEATEARAQRDAMQRDLAAARARVTELENRGPPGPPPEMVQEIERLRGLARAQAEQSAAQQQALGRFAGAQAEALQLARQKEAERAATEAALTRARAAIDACEVKNTELFRTATEILNLYQTPDFQSLLTRSREPLLGIWRTRLENIVQEHEDRIRDGRFHRAGFPIPPVPPATPLPPAAQERPRRGTN